MADRPDIGALLGAVAPLLGGPAQPDASVGRAFHEAMAALVVFDHVVVFAYRGQATPVDLFSTFAPAAYETFVSLYQAGPYLLDPFFHAALAGRTGLWRMRELAPDRFFSSDYFRSYYSQTELAEEIGFFVPVENDTTIVLSLMRRQERRVFTRAEIGLLNDAEPFVTALVQKFWRGIATSFGTAAKSSRQKSTGKTPEKVWTLDLTRREALIVDLVLQGHSSDAIGRQLRIAAGTVKVHRRNIYRKLDISSQAQLLSLYLRAQGITPSR